MCFLLSFFRFDWNLRPNRMGATAASPLKPCLLELAAEPIIFWSLAPLSLELQGHAAPPPAAPAASSWKFGFP